MSLTEAEATAAEAAHDAPEPKAAPDPFEQARADRRAAQDQVPLFHLQDRHLADCRLLPDRRALLARLPRKGIAAEIGAAFGDFTREIFELADPAVLHLVDAWSTDRYKAGLARIKQRHADLIRRDRLKIDQGLSTAVLPQFADDYFDWVYIDTDHTYATTIEELRIAARVVRPAGRICGHDHCTGNVIKPFPYGVIQAVAQFCVEEGYGYEYLTAEPNGHASFCLKKL